jgi:hypothetical protein
VGQPAVWERPARNNTGRVAVLLEESGRSQVQLIPPNTPDSLPGRLRFRLPPERNKAGPVNRTRSLVNYR